MREFLKSNLWGQLAFGFALGAIGLFAIQPSHTAQAIAHHVSTIVHHHA